MASKEPIVIHSWERQSGNTTLGPFDLPAGEYVLSAAMPATIERLVGETIPAVIETVMVAGNAQLREKTPAVQEWTPVTGGKPGEFTAVAGTYRVSIAPGSGRVSISTKGN